jgi:hypothetical protein
MSSPYARPKRGIPIFGGQDRPPDANFKVVDDLNRGRNKSPGPSAGGQGRGHGGSYRPPGDIGKPVHGSTKLNPNVDSWGNEVEDPSKEKGK